MLATIVNALAIVVGGFCGFLFGKLLTEPIQEGLIKACGVCVIFIGQPVPWKACCLSMEAIWSVVDPC